MSGAEDWNATVIEEFRANEGRALPNETSGASMGGLAAAAAGRSALPFPGPLRRPTDRSCACRFAGD